MANAYILVNIKHHSLNGGGGGGLKIFARKGGEGKGKWGSLSINGGLPYYIMILHDVAYEKNLDVFINKINLPFATIKYCLNKI